MTLQYARMFQFRAGIQLIGEGGPSSKDELAEMLRQRKDFDFAKQDSLEGAEDIISGLRNAHLVIKSTNGFKLTNDEELQNAVEQTTLLYTGEDAYAAGGQRSQSDRILANIMYEHPMLIQLSKYIFRNGPVKAYEVKKEFDGAEYLGDAMNSFTIDMGLNLLSDAAVIKEAPNGYVSDRWPIRLFAHIVFQEVSDLNDDNTESVREPELFERIETVYGIDKSTFDNLISQLHAAGIVSESSYEELILNATTLEKTKIHE